MKKIIITNKEKEKNKKDKIKSSFGRTDRGRRREREFYNFYFSFVSLSDLRKLDCRFSSEQKVKLDYAKRATSRYQYLSLLSNFKKEGNFPTCIISSLKAM